MLLGILYSMYACLKTQVSKRSNPAEDDGFFEKGFLAVGSETEDFQAR